MTTLADTLLTTPANATEDPKIYTWQQVHNYTCADKGMMLPLVNEFTWSEHVRGALYLVALLYCFLGVAIIADIFMGAIEKITSKTKKIFISKLAKDRYKEAVTGSIAAFEDAHKKAVIGSKAAKRASQMEEKAVNGSHTKLSTKESIFVSKAAIKATKEVVYLTMAGKDEPEVYEVRIWSDAVANLTLMALGSSAPEILLACIEVVGNKFEAGALGPGTIVGSAAFNLFVISAVCVMCIPNGEKRRVNDIKVFAITSVFSLIAYIWLLVILVASTPNVVDIWEAVVTLAFFPILVFLAWIAEKNFCGMPSKAEASKQMELGTVENGGEKAALVKDRQYFKDGRMDRDGLVRFIKECKKYPGLTDEDAAALAATKLVESQSHSRMWYRVGAVRNMTGGRKTQPQLTMKLKEVYNVMNEHPDAPTLGKVPSVKPYKNAIIDFHASSCAVMENIGTFTVEVLRSGRLDHQVCVRVETIEGTATENQDYVAINKVITFQPGEEKQSLEIEIINDNQWEPDEEFYLRMSLLNDQSERENVQLGRVSIMEIVILNDDEPGVISFTRRGLLVKESVGMAVIQVVRKNGADGEVSVKWRTIDKSAINGKDYTGGEGVLTFKHTEVAINLEIPIIDDMSAEKDEHFEIELCEPSGGARIGQINRTAVTITNDDDFDTVLSKITDLTSANLDAIQVHQETYLGQIRDALNVNGGDLENASGSDYVLHFFTFGWKVIFSLVPPPSIMGGWLCFFVSLAAIGVLTAIIGDLATIFGCLVGLRDPVTAITFVALGTSLPDTFASKAAAIQEKYADNAIGNVTGSNSVNVFLGLGLPWLMASIYHWSKGSEFRVNSGDLGFSVGLFTGLSIVCLSIIMMRRFLTIFGKTELGGPAVPKYICGCLMIGLWFIYVLVSSLQTYEYFNFK